MTQKKEPTYRVKDWGKFQHFKDRTPPWIKLYRNILDDVEWHELAPEAAKGLVMLWLIASENDGYLPNIKKLAFRLRTTEKATLSILCKLSHWLEHDDINVISNRYQDDAPERETETERETEGEGETDTMSGLKPTTLQKPGISKHQAQSILDFMNLRLQRGFSAETPNGKVTANGRLIMDRLKDGFTEDDCRAVFIHKLEEWGADDKMRKFLRPETLFCASKFSTYLGECQAIGPAEAERIKSELAAKLRADREAKAMKATTNGEPEHVH